MDDAVIQAQALKAARGALTCRNGLWGNGAPGGGFSGRLNVGRSGSIAGGATFGMPMG